MLALGQGAAVLPEVVPPSPCLQVVAVVLFLPYPGLSIQPVSLKQEAIREPAERRDTWLPSAGSLELRFLEDHSFAMCYLNKEVASVREKKTGKELGLQWNVAYGRELSEMDRGDTSVF